MIEKLESTAIAWLAKQGAGLTEDEDREGRQALAELLYSGQASRDILKLMAFAIAPDGNELADEGRLDFKRRQIFVVPKIPEGKEPKDYEAWERENGKWQSPGKPSNPHKTKAIAETIRNAQTITGRSVEESVQLAMKEFGISREYAYRVWGKFEGLYATLDAARQHDVYCFIDEQRQAGETMDASLEKAAERFDVSPEYAKRLLKAASKKTQ